MAADLHTEEIECHLVRAPVDVEVVRPDAGDEAYGFLDRRSLHAIIVPRRCVVAARRATFVPLS
jgi:hypothetical protein